MTDGTTITGDGTTAAPLSIKLPLTLNAAPATGAVLTVNNTMRGAAIQTGGVVTVDDEGDGSTVVEGISRGNSGSAIFGTTPQIHPNGPYGTGADFAGEFQGAVEVVGTLSKSGGSFKIDHPLDPANKYLYHSFVESPDMMNVYNGLVTTDGTGNATVQMPSYFSALNSDFRYQLTVIGADFAQAIVSAEIANNQFSIRTDKPLVKVSWQVTGIRQDAWAQANRIPVEQAKQGVEQGTYLHPELFGAEPGKSVEWARHPKLMQELKEKGLIQ